MEFELWMLLIFPLFFGMGWLAARMDIKQLVDESSALPRSYFEGLNFLLNEQQDKAIDAFIEVVKVDPQTVELHFALGSLFRRRGEVDRALRMHLNLAERADLDRDKKQQALFELAQDYLKAGMLDRAEQTFLSLENTPYAKQSLDFLLEIYQKEKDWQKAVSIAARLEQLTGTSQARETAAFYCELATEAQGKNQPELARDCLNLARQVWPQAVRASMLLGDMDWQAQQPEQAMIEWQRIEQQDARYLPLIAERLLKAYRALGREQEGLALLQRYQQQYPSLDLMNVLFDAVHQRFGVERAYELVREELHRNPSLLGLEKLLEARLLDAPDDRRADVELVKNLVHQRTRSLAMYRCTQCGFKARQFYWHCPACHGWDTYPPRRTEETGLPL